MPRKDCIELKSLKMYLLAYRDLGIFYENAVNKMLHDIVDAIAAGMVRRPRRIHPAWRPDHLHLLAMADASLARHG